MAALVSATLYLGGSVTCMLDGGQYTADLRTTQLGMSNHLRCSDIDLDVDLQADIYAGQAIDPEVGIEPTAYRLQGQRSKVIRLSTSRCLAHPVGTCASCARGRWKFAPRVIPRAPQSSGYDDSCDGGGPAVGRSARRAKAGSGSARQAAPGRVAAPLFHDVGQVGDLRVEYE